MTIVTFLSRNINVTQIPKLHQAYRVRISNFITFLGYRLELLYICVIVLQFALIHFIILLLAKCTILGIAY